MSDGKTGSESTSDLLQNVHPHPELPDGAEGVGKAHLASLLRRVFRAAKIGSSPTSTRKHHCMGCGDRAGKPRRGFLRRFLKIQSRVLALALAGWAKVRLPAHALFIWLGRVHEGSASNIGKFVSGELHAALFFLLKQSFKLTFFLLERRERVVLRLQRVLETEYGHPRTSDLFEKVFDSFGDLSRIALSDKPFGNGLGTSKGCNGKANFIEHGCPSDGSMRVEELALSVRAGGPPYSPKVPETGEV